MIVDNGIVLKYSAKIVSIEAFINRRNMEKPQLPSVKKRGTAQRLFQKLSERTASF